MPNLYHNASGTWREFENPRAGQCPFYSWRGVDLRGVDMTQYTIRGNNLTGARRSPEDPPIRGWVVDEDGELAPACVECNEALEEYSSCEYCESCCEHATCPSCGDHDINACDHCDRCSGCCACTHCAHCGDRIDTDDCECPYSEHCDDCCECSNRNQGLCEPGKPWPAHSPLDRKQFDCARLVGVEWEFNDNADIRTWCDTWRGGKHTDGSCGFEAVTAPLAGDHLVRCLHALANVLDGGTTANSDCGIHVHVDASDLRWADMYRLLHVYARVEPILYVLAGQQRVKNEYAAPCGLAYRGALGEVDRKGAIMGVALSRGRALAAKDARDHVRNVAPHKKDGGRYKGLNICPWLAARHKWTTRQDPVTAKKRIAPSKRDCTVEFRLHRNSLDGERVANWAMLCARIVDWVAHASDAQAAALPKSPLRALAIIAPDLAPWILGRVRAWRTATTTRQYASTRGAPRRITLRNGKYTIIGGGETRYAEEDEEF